MRVQVRLFGRLAEAAQRRELVVDLPPGASVSSLLQALASGGASLGRLSEALAVAVNMEYVSLDCTLKEGDEVALIPPVSGGASNLKLRGEPPTVLFHVTRDAIDPAALTALVASPDCGAVLTFLGTVRNNSEGKRVVGMEYDAYQPMALKELERIGAEGRARWAGLRLAIWHRFGPMAVGQVSLVIAVAMPHRAEAFEASRWALEAVKARLPIWKKEFAEDGSWWAEGTVPTPQGEGNPRG